MDLDVVCRVLLLVLSAHAPVVAHCVAVEIAGWVEGAHRDGRWVALAAAREFFEALLLFLVPEVEYTIGPCSGECAILGEQTSRD